MQSLKLEPALLSFSVIDGSVLTKAASSSLHAANAVYAYVPGVPSAVRSVATFIVEHPAFDVFMIAAIIANAITLSMPFEGMSSEYEERIQHADWAFVLLFAVEMVVRLCALGLRGYWLNGAFAFDGAVTVISLADMALSMQGQRSRGFSVIRIFRLFRAMQFVPGLRGVINVIVSALPATA